MCPEFADVALLRAEVETFSHLELWHDEIYSGELDVEIGPPVDLTDAMRGLLKLDPD